MTLLTPSAVCSGFCLLGVNWDHLAIIHLGHERACTPVGSELRDGQLGPDSQCLNLSLVVADVLPLAFQLPLLFLFLFFPCRLNQLELGLLLCDLQHE